MTLTARVVTMRQQDPSLSLTEIAEVLGVERDEVAQIIAKKRKRGVFIPAGTSTSRGHVGKYTFKKRATP